MVTATEALVDFHCHLSRVGGINALRSAQPALGDTSLRVVAVTNTVSEWRRLSAVDVGGDVVVGIGVHPGERHASRDVGLLGEAVSAAEVIGEVGLDFRGGSRVSRAEQYQILEQVLALAENQPKIVSIHSAGAYEEVVETLQGRNLPGAILHWFLGAERVIDRAIDQDVFFSINPAMLGSAGGRRAVLSMPPNRVVLESDAPYGLNLERVGGDLGRSLSVMVSALSRLWRLSPVDARTRILANQTALLSRAPIRQWT